MVAGLNFQLRQFDSCFHYTRDGNLINFMSHAAPASYMYIHATCMTAASASVCIIYYACLLYTSPSPRDATLSRMPSSA